MAQGFLDFGKSAVDLFGTGGASIADLIESARTGKVTTRNSDDFRKWLYDTNDVKDAAAKGLGTALNGVQTVSDYIPGIGAVTRNPLFNAGQGALGGLADEFKMYGKDYDLGRAGQRAAVGAGGALASTGLADALKGSGNALLKSGTAQGLARGAVGGAIGAGGYTAIDGGSLGDVANSALQGAGMGAALGGTMGALQDFRPAKTYDMALTDEEKAARIANAKNMLANEQDPERIAELNNQIKDLGGTLADADMAVNSPKLTPEQEAYFKDSVIRDESGNLIPLYHGSNSKFTVFDSNKGGQSNGMAKVGHWFTPSEEGAEKWAGRAWWGDNDPTVYETYLNIKKPMVYEPVDNSAQIEKLNAQLRQVEDRLDSTYRGSQEYYDAYKEYNNIANEIDNLSYTDPYEQFRSQVYAMEGKTPSQANVGGVGMAMNDEDAAVQKYIDMLKGEGYDGIIIKGTGYDQNVMGGPNDQYVVFDSNQIKSTNNLRPTENPDIMMSKLAPGEADLARALANQDLSINNAKVAPGQLGLFDDMPTQTPKTGTRQTSLFDQPQDGLDYYGGDIETPAASGPVDRSVEDLTKIAIDESTLPKGWKKAQELANMGKRAKQIVLDPNDPNRARNEYNVALYSDAQYGRNMPVADIIDKLGQIQYGREIDRGAARLLADQLDESGDEFAKKFVTGAAEAGGNISHYRDAPKAKLADEQLSNLLNIGRSNSMLSDSLANPSSRNARGDQWKGTINLDGKSIAKGSDGGISTFGHERLHAFQDAGNMGYDQRVVDAYNELHDDLSKIYHSDSQIRKDYGSDVKYWSKPIEQEARMAQFYLEDKFGVKGAQRVPERDANGKAIRYKDDGTIADPNNLLDYYTGKPAYKGEFEGDRKAINAAFDKFRGKLQDLTRKGVALPALTALFGGGAYMASQENDKEKEVK